MFTVTRTGPDRLDIDISGQLDSDAMREALTTLFDHAKGIEHGKMLYSIGGFDIPTLGAIGIELARLPELFSLARQFDKAAVVCDQKWLRTASEIEGALIPGLTIKAFTREEKAAAEAWLNS